jgi:TrmH family RNA methyltransferase
LKSIASRSNPLVKQLRALARPGQAARREGLVWLEGIHLCQEYLQRIGAPRHAVFDASRLADAGARELQALARALPEASCLALEAGLLDGISDVAAAQGVGFLAELPRPALPTSVDTACVVLDGVQDPGNVGSILRTCAAAGIGTLFLLEGSASAWSPKVLRAGQGAHFSLTIHEQMPARMLLDRLAVPLLATTLEDAAGLYDVELPCPAAWVFGHEGQGVSAALLERATHRVHIPQASGVESLNVAAAAAVCLFEHRRQRLLAAGR